MKPILGALLPVDVEDEGFWTDLETFYLPNRNIEMATADDWRTAYIMVRSILYRPYSIDHIIWSFYGPYYMVHIV